MASSGKKKTTFAKLARESKQRERRQDKQARKVARRRAAELHAQQVVDGVRAGDELGLGEAPPDAEA